MATTLHSFMDIFGATFGEGQEAVQLKKIIIPIIQSRNMRNTHFRT